MPAEPRQPQDTTGIIHIVRQNRSGGQSRASEFLVSFGGKKDGVGAFRLGGATGSDPLTALLRKIGVSPAEVDTALQVLASGG
jgi:hypothetical protein